MDPSKAKEADKTSAADVEVETHYLHAAYVAPSARRQALVTNSRLLEIFRLDPTNAALPRFVGRWDQTSFELDIDIDLKGIPGLSGWQRYRMTRRFKRGKDGYSGHCTRQLATHEYEVKICVSENDFPQFQADSRVFSGVVRLSNVRGEKYLATKSDSISSVEADLTVSRPDGKAAPVKPT